MTATTRAAAAPGKSRRALYAAASAFTIATWPAAPGYAQTSSAPSMTSGTTANSNGPASNQAPAPAQPNPNAPVPVRGGVPFNQHYFNFTAGLDLSENYTTNAAGAAGTNVSDVYTRVGLNLGLDTERQRYSIHAAYTLNADFYYNHSRLNQITNHLNLDGKAQLIPDILKIEAQAFAQPIVLSQLGNLTSNNRAVPNGVIDSYGYSVEPDLKFRLGDALISELIVDHGGVFFTSAHGSTPGPIIPGFVGPADTFTTAVTERLSSGDFFERFKWDVTGSDAETTQAPRNLSERSGLGTLSYALSHELSVLATGGYESIETNVALTKKLSGPVYFGGFQYSLGPSVQVDFRAGQQFNSLSFLGSLHYELTPTAAVVGTLTDSVTTPEAQLIGNLAGLGAAPNGGFVDAGALFSSGLAPSLANFDPAFLNNLSLEQSIVRNRNGFLTLYDDMARTHIALSFEVELRQTLSALPPGVPANTRAVGGSFRVSRDIRRNFKGEASFSYLRDTEFGGRADIFTTEGGLDYQLSQMMALYLRGSYIRRDSSASLRALTPVAGNLDEGLVTIGITRKFY